MESQIICAHCNEQFRADNLPRILIGCGHTFCQSCLTSFIVENQDGIYAQCPDDQTQTQLTQSSVAKMPKNLALIKVIENKKQNSSFRDNQISVSKIVKHSRLQEEEATELVDFMDDKNCQKQRSIQFLRPNQQSAKQKISKLKLIKQTNQQTCKIHKKPLDIVCTVDLKKICASCAIFGEHRGHSFKSLDQISQMQNQYCRSITHIIKEKQKISKQVDCNQTKNDILSILTSKKNKLRTKIVQQFQKLQSKITNKKKQVLKSLDQIVKKQQSNLKNCMKFDGTLVKSYDQWLKKSQSQLKILQQHDFQAKLILLFEGISIDGDIIEEGNSLIDEMKLEEQNILIQVEKKLQNLKMNVNEQIFNHIDDFIQVTGQSYKQISNITVKTDQVIMNQSQRPSLAPININTTLNSVVLPHQLNKVQNKGDATQRRVQPFKPYETVLSSYLQSEPINNNLDQSLLENDEQSCEPEVVQFEPRMSVICPPTVSPIPLTQRFSIQSNRQSPIIEKQPLNKLKIPSGDHMETVKGQKMNKKKLSKLKLPQRFQKIVECLLADSLDIVDFTSGQFGDVIMATVCENLLGTKARTLKLIRNKLTDEGVAKILPYMGQITTLNLSQNLLTDNILDILFDNHKSLASLRTVILSQNKIVERKHKAKIDRLKKLQWTISL